MSKMFDKLEAKKIISSIANQANLLIKTNQSITNELAILSDYAIVTKTILKTILSSNSIQKNDIIQDLNATLMRLMIANKNLKSDKMNIDSKITGEMKIINSTIMNDIAELNTLKEDTFLLENELQVKEAQIMKLRKDIKNMNIIQELEKDVFITIPENVENFFRTDNAIYQEELTKASRSNNNEKQRKIDLYNQLQELKKTKKLLLKGIDDNNIKKNKDNNSLHHSFDNNNDNSRNSYFSDLFHSSQGSHSSNEDADFTFPNKVKMTNIISISLNLPPKSPNTNLNIKALIPSLATIDNNINHQFQLPTQPNVAIESHHLETQINEMNDIIPTQPNQVPKLDLKLIEYNKLKVQNDDDDYYFDDNINEEDNNDNVLTAKDDIAQKIINMRKDISLIYKKITKNKHKINTFKRCYTKMCSKYTLLQKKLQKITGIECNQTIQSNKEYNTMITKIKVKKV